MTFHGRFIVHAVSQYLSAKEALDFVRVVDAGCYTGMCYLIVQRLSQEVSNKSLLAVLSLALLLAIPAAGYCFLGNISFSVNYVWTAFLNVAFLYLFTSPRVAASAIIKMAVVLLALLTGAMQESFSIGVSVGLLVYLWVNRQTIGRWKLYAALAYWLGSALIIFAPGNFVRVEEHKAFDVSLVNKLVQGIGSILVYAHAYTLLLMALVAYGWRHCSEARQFLRDNCILFVSATVGALFAALVVLLGPHQLVSVEIFSVILLLKLFYRWWNVSSLGRTWDSILRMVCLVISLALLIPIYYYRHQVGTAYEQMVESARHSTDGTMLSTDYDRWSFSPRNWFVRNYTSTEYNQVTMLGNISMWLTNFQNEHLITCRLPLPKGEILAMSTAENEIAPSIFHRTEDFFFIVRTEVPEDETAPPCTLTCQQNKLSALRAVLLGEDVKEMRSELNLAEVSHFDHQGARYYIVYDNDARPIKNIQLQQ